MATTNKPTLRKLPSHPATPYHNKRLDYLFECFTSQWRHVLNMGDLQTLVKFIEFIKMVEAEEQQAYLDNENGVMR
jgi:hypothetical protein